MAPRLCTWRFKIRDVVAPARRLPVKSKRRSYDYFSTTELALLTKTPPEDRSRIASEPIGFTRCSGRRD